jgi:hypothetical protein
MSTNTEGRRPIFLGPGQGRRYGATGGVVDARRTRSGRIPPLLVLSSTRRTSAS